MAGVRRWYIFIICAVALQSVTWAIIYLLRNTLAPAGAVPVSSTAFQIAVIVVGLPLFLVHWLWAQRLASLDTGERESIVRWVYLYGMLAAFVGPFLFQAFDLFSRLARLAMREAARPSGSLVAPPVQLGLRDLVAMAVLAIFWYYHWRIVSRDARAVPETGDLAAIRRLYVLGFSAAGLTLTILGINHLVSWLLWQTNLVRPAAGLNRIVLADEIARLGVGLPTWLLFWSWAQWLYHRGGEREQESALRKLYLYGAVFIAVLGAVGSAAAILAGILRRVLGVPPQGDLRIPLSIMSGMAVLWAYHAHILGRDAAETAEAPRQAGIRRLYNYMVAGIALAAFLGGLAGMLGVLIRAVGTAQFQDAYRAQLAWFIAALIAGLLVWVWPWRRSEIAAEAPTPTGVEERRSIVRKIYLYVYLTLATLTVLSSAIYILYRLLSLVLGARAVQSQGTQLAQAVAYLLIGVAVWVYHGLVLRRDGRLGQADQAASLAGWRVAVLDGGQGQLGQALLDRLRRELPGVELDAVGLTPEAASAMGASGDDLPGRLRAASVIVGPWVMAVPGGTSGVPPEVAAQIIASPAPKVLVPSAVDGWQWAGVSVHDVEDSARQATRAVKQLVEGGGPGPTRSLSAVAIAGIVIVALVGLPLLVGLLVGLSRSVGFP